MAGLREHISLSLSYSSLFSSLVFRNTAEHRDRGLTVICDLATGHGCSTEEDQAVCSCVRACVFVCSAALPPDGGVNFLFDSLPVTAV